MAPLLFCLFFPARGVLGGLECFLGFGDGSNVSEHPVNTEVYIGMAEIEHIYMIRERGKREDSREREIFMVYDNVFSPHIYIQCMHTHYVHT